MALCLTVIMALLPVWAQAQRGDGMISGRIISAGNNVVDFATVQLKNTGYGTTTNREGLYHLSAPAGKYTLVVSAMGYKKWNVRWN